MAATQIYGRTSQEERNQILRRQRRNRIVGKLVLTVVAACIVFVFFFPIYYWARLSIVPYKDTFVIPPRLDIITTTDAWWSVVMGDRTYRDVILEQAGANAGVGGAGTSGYDIRPRIVNSLFLGISSTAVVIMVATFTAYALSRFEPRGKQSLVFFILSTRFMPPVAVVLPLYLIYGQLGLRDTREGLILAHVVINLPLAILLLKSFFDDVPRDLDEAAMVDGCTRFGAFARVVVRYVAPGVAAAAVLSFIFSWNEFIFALYLTRIPEMRTVPVTMMTYDASSGPTEWGFMAAAGTAAMVPVFFLILFVQRYLIRGLTMGAVRG
ncbi:MAG: carbohydrate ABC transporter permease [Anaerolineaceae bacterium]|nr:carbohydrate ABC transporter permease [Anaerolineaceae bacterium]